MPREAAESQSAARAGRAFTAHLYVRPAHLLMAVSVTTLVIAHVSSLVFHLYKLYYFGWLICCYLLILLAAGGRIVCTLRLGTVLPVLAFFAYLGLSALWSYDPAMSRLYTFYGLLFPVAFAAGVVWAENLNGRWLSTYVLGLLTVVFVLMSMALVSKGRLIDEELGSVRSGYAYIFVTSLPILVWRAVGDPGFRRYALAVVVVITAGIIGSRTALLLLPIILLATLLVTLRNPKQRLKVIALVGAMCLIGGTVVAAVPAIRSGFLESIGRFSASNTSFDITSDVEAELSVPVEQQRDIDRRLQAFVAINSFLEHPLIGAGYMSTFSITADWYGRDLSAHGLPFTLLGETGIIGTILFGWMMLVFFRRVSSGLKRVGTEEERAFWRSVRVTMVAMLLFGLFHQVHQDPAFYVVLGWGYALAHRAPLVA